MAKYDRLVGEDGELQKASFGTPLITGTAAAGSWYRIEKMQGNTVFPAGYQVGDIWQGDGTSTFTATNSASLATFETVADVSSFNFDFSSDEVEVTVLIDGVKKYRRGKTDLSGSISGINMLSEMKKPGSLLNKFLRVVTGDKLSTADSVLNPVDNAPYYLRAMIQKDTMTAGEDHAFLFGEVELLGYGLGADLGSAQTWESNVRFINRDPIVYIISN